jgi:polygalacturonase
MRNPMERLRVACGLGTVLVLLGCSGEQPAILGQEEVPVVPTANVRDFGARGDDAVDDTEAFNAAIRALPVSGGRILVPGGLYMLTARHSHPNRVLDISEKHNIAIVGDGMELTTLRMSPAVYSSATFLVYIKMSDGIVIQDLSLDSNRDEVVYRDEQSHGIEIVSSRDIRISGVRFENSGGDGIRLFGLTVADPWTEHVTIENSHFRDATRNGISMQRAVRNVTIRNNRFERISDQSISSEPSGNGSPTDILIEGNTVTHSFTTWAIALAGTKPRETMKRLTFRNNLIENGAAYFLWIEDLSIEGNTFLGDPYHSTLRLGDVRQARVVRNSIEGRAEQGPGVVQVVNHNDPFSAMVTIQDNDISDAESLTGIFVRDAVSDTGGKRAQRNSFLEQCGYGYASALDFHRGQ